MIIYSGECIFPIISKDFIHMGLESLLTLSSKYTKLALLKMAKSTDSKELFSNNQFQKGISLNSFR